MACAFLSLIYSIYLNSLMHKWNVVMPHILMPLNQKKLNVKTERKYVMIYVSVVQVQ